MRSGEKGRLKHDSRLALKGVAAIWQGFILLHGAAAQVAHFFLAKSATDVDDGDNDNDVDDVDVCR